MQLSPVREEGRGGKHRSKPCTPGLIQVTLCSVDLGIAWQGGGSVDTDRGCAVTGGGGKEGRISAQYGTSRLLWYSSGFQLGSFFRSWVLDVSLVWGFGPGLALD